MIAMDKEETESVDICVEVVEKYRCCGLFGPIYEPRMEKQKVRVFYATGNEFFYSCTTKDKIESILATGLLPSKGGEGRSLGTPSAHTSKGYVYFCESPEVAQRLGQFFFSTKDEIAIVKFKLLRGTKYTNDPESNMNSRQALRTNETVPANLIELITEKNNGKISRRLSLGSPLNNDEI